MKQATETREETNMKPCGRTDCEGNEVAAAWERWAGDTRWSRAAKLIEAKGGHICWWAGYPQSASAIPLTFSLYDESGRKVECHSRLRDLERMVQA